MYICTFLFCFVFPSKLTVELAFIACITIFWLILGCYCLNLSSLHLPIFCPDSICRQEQPRSTKVLEPWETILNQWKTEALIENSSISYTIWAILKGILTLQISRGNLESKPIITILKMYLSSCFGICF